MTTTQSATILNLIRELASTGHPATNALSGLFCEHEAMLATLRDMATEPGHGILSHAAAVTMVREVDGGEMGVAL